MTTDYKDYINKSLIYQIATQISNLPNCVINTQELDIDKLGNHTDNFKQAYEKPTFKTGLELLKTIADLSGSIPTDSDAHYMAAFVYGSAYHDITDVTKSPSQFIVRSDHTLDRDTTTGKLVIKDSGDNNNPEGNALLNKYSVLSNDKQFYKYYVDYLDSASKIQKPIKEGIDEILEELKKKIDPLIYICDDSLEYSLESEPTTGEKRLFYCFNSNTVKVEGAFKYLLEGEYNNTTYYVYGPSSVFIDNNNITKDADAILKHYFESYFKEDSS